jgi:hypothetical protein
MSEVKSYKSKDSYVKQHVIQQIDNLKSDIQNLIDKKKSLKSKEEIQECLEMKQKKMDQLKILNNKLKDIIKQERYEIQKQNEIIMVSKAIDTLEFTGAKKRNGHKALDKAKEEKAQRDQVKMQFLEYKEMEKKYFECDCSKLPSYLFLSKNILKSYGLCPHLDLDLENPIDKDILYNKRLDWLTSQTDQGKILFDLHKDLIQENDLNKLQLQKTHIENDISKFIDDNFTKSQYYYFENAINFLQEYLNCHIKTKRIKERFKLMINDLSILFSETSFEIHTYLSIRFDIPIVVNIMENKNTKNPLELSLMTEKFSKYLEDYRNTIENIQNKKKYIINTLKNLKMDLYYYLTDKQAFLKKENIIESKRSNVIQNGKYFKKWSSLTQTEKLERLTCFAIYYIDKNLIENKIIDQSKRQEYINLLDNLLLDGFKTKILTYKNLSWNIKRGIVENIKTLKQENLDDKIVFTLQNTNENQDLNSNQTSSNTKVQDKKKISSKSIINKESEKIINEQLLYFIIKRIQSGVENITDEDKENYLNKLKTKLKIKKISTNDKKQIFDKYTEIFNLVKQNT